MPEHPESFPVNALVPIEGTPLEGNDVSFVSAKVVTMGLTFTEFAIACSVPYTSPDYFYRSYRASNNDHPISSGQADSRRV